MPNVWRTDIPVSPIYQDIQLGNCCSGFPRPSHWLMPFALRSSARIGRCSCRWPPVRLVIPDDMRTSGQELWPTQASSTWRVLSVIICTLATNDLCAYRCALVQMAEFKFATQRCASAVRYRVSSVKRGLELE
jgi:hypothetical protein